MADKITLYHYWRSSASWRVRWGLELKGIAHEKVAIDLLKSAEKEADYLRRNPSGYLPCLIVGDHPPIAESLAILEWLEENYPKPSFFSGDSYQRALIRRLAETVNSGIQPLQNLDILKRVSSDTEQQGEWARHWIQRGLTVYEKLLSAIDRKGCAFSVSNQPSLADICLIPQCYTGLRFKVDLGVYPQCRAIYEYALTTRECAASLPEAHQPL